MAVAAAQQLCLVAVQELVVVAAAAAVGPFAVDWPSQDPVAVLGMTHRLSAGIRIARSVVVVVVVAAAAVSSSSFGYAGSGSFELGAGVQHQEYATACEPSQEAVAL